MGRIDDVANYAKASLFTGLNAIGTVTGSWGKIYNAEALATMSEEGRAKLVEEYNESIGLPKDGLPNQDGFDKYMESRIAGIDGFSAIKAPNNKSISKMLATASDAVIPNAVSELAAAPDAVIPNPVSELAAASNDVKEKFKACFNQTEDTDGARQRFKADMENIHAFVQHDEANYHPRDLVNYLHNIKNEAYRAIKSQQTQEKKNLEDLFKEELFRAPLKKILDINDDQLNNIQKEVFQSLEKSHQDKLATFETEMDEPIKKLHAAAQVERVRVAFLADLYKGNKNTRAMLDALHEKNKTEGTIHVAENLDGSVNKKVIFKGIKVTDLPVISTITGRKIKNNGDGSFSMSLPNHIFTTSPLYYMSSDNRLKKDLMAIPLAIRAAGYSSITMTVTQGKNEEEAKEIAREAYAACLEAGFDDKDISLVVNGKKMSNDELFATCPARRQTANMRSVQNMKQLDKDLALPKAGEAANVTRIFKEAVDEFRQRPPEAAAAVEAPRPE